MGREPEEDDSAPWKEQENWEGDQIRRAMTKTGARDQARPAEQYDYVFENQIDFITDAAARGEMVNLASRSHQMLMLCVLLSGSKVCCLSPRPERTGHVSIEQGHGSSGCSPCHPRQNSSPCM